MRKSTRGNQEMNLILFRHAKSQQDAEVEDDRARPLAVRGVEAARLVGALLRDRDLVPDLVLCSPAVRTRETWGLAAAQLPSPPPVREIEELYDFGDGSTVLAAIRSEGRASRRLLVVGHNPSLQNLALRLAGKGKDAIRSKMQAKFPTAALGVFRCRASSWGQLDETSCELTDFICPAELGAD
jgi:phosphohistidine phosphatase